MRAFVNMGCKPPLKCNKSFKTGSLQGLGVENNIFTQQHKCTLESVCMTILYVCLCVCTRQDHEWWPAFCNAYLQTICPVQASLGDGELIYFSPFNKINTHSSDMQSHLEIVAVWQKHMCKIIAMTMWQHLFWSAYQLNWYFCSIFC